MKVQQRLIDIAKQELPPLVGETYSKVVLSCLEILDNRAIGNGDVLRSLEGDVGTMFIRHVIKKLEGLTVV